MRNHHKLSHPQKMIVQQNKRILLFFCLFLVGCNNLSSERKVFNKTTQEALVQKEQGLIVGQDIVVAGTHLNEIDLNELGQTIQSFTANHIFVCNENTFFLSSKKYCYYFDNLKLSMNLNQNGNVGIFAENAFATKNLNEYLLKQTTIALSNSDYILESTGIIWNLQTSLLQNNTQDDTNEFMTLGGSSIKGNELTMDYKKNEFTLKKVTAVLKEEIH